MVINLLPHYTQTKTFYSANKFQAWAVCIKFQGTARLQEMSSKRTDHDHLSDSHS